MVKKKVVKKKWTETAREAGGLISDWASRERDIGGGYQGGGGFDMGSAIGTGGGFSSQFEEPSRPRAIRKVRRKSRQRTRVVYIQRPKPRRRRVRVVYKYV